MTADDVMKMIEELSRKLPKPNPEQDWAQLAAQWRQWFILTGSAYLHCVPNEKNPTEVRVISPLRVQEGIARV